MSHLLDYYCRHVLRLLVNNWLQGCRLPLCEGGRDNECLERAFKSWQCKLNGVRVGWCSSPPEIKETSRLGGMTKWMINHDIGQGC